MTKQTGRYQILEQFKADGIRYIFGNPGTVEQGFLDALMDTEGIEYILSLQETIALAMADGYARATKKPTVVQLHSGVGVGNGIGMIYQAMRGHAPLVVIAGEAGIQYDAMDAQMACDLVKLTAPVTKWSTRVVDPSSVLRVLRRAIKIASTPPMGPVFVNLPMDVLDAVTEIEKVFPTPVLNTRVQPGPETINEIAAILAGSKNPIIIMGDGVAFSGAQSELAAVAEKIGAGVWGADNSEVNIDATHPLYKGNLGHMFGSHSTPIVSKADAVLITGTYVLPEVFPTLSNIFREGAKVVHIDLNAYEIAKNFPVDIGVVADPKLTLASLNVALTQLMTAEQVALAAKRAETIGKEKASAHENAIAADLKVAAEVPMRPGFFMKELAARLDEEPLIFDEALTSSPELNRYLPGKNPGSFFQTRGGSLGVGVPGAIGLKLANPDKIVIGFSGDGGSMYTIQALWSAARHNIGAKFVICNNHNYKLLELNVQQYWRERDIAEREFPSMFNLAEPAIQFADLAKALGIQAEKVEKPEEVGPAIDRMLSTPGPYLIDLVLTGDVANHMVGVKCGQ